MNDNNNLATYSSSSSSSNYNNTDEIKENHQGDLNARKAAAKRKRWADMKIADPEKYAESLAKMRQYHQRTKELRLAHQKVYRSSMSEEQRERRSAQQREYRSSMSEEQIQYTRSKDKQYQRKKYTEMMDAEMQLINPSSLADENDTQKLSRLANKRQQVLTRNRNYKSRRWANIEQVWDEDFPCR